MMCGRCGWDMTTFASKYDARTVILCNNPDCVDWTLGPMKSVIVLWERECDHPECAKTTDGRCRVGNNDANTTQ